MAIDTKEKRAGVLGVARPWMRDKFPVAVPDEQWRISTGHAYGGNALSPDLFLSFGKRAATPMRGLVAATSERGLIAKRPQRGLVVEDLK